MKRAKGSRSVPSRLRELFARKLLQGHECERDRLPKCQAPEPFRVSCAVDRLPRGRRRPPPPLQEIITRPKGFVFMCGEVH